MKNLLTVFIVSVLLFSCSKEEITELETTSKIEGVWMFSQRDRAPISDCEKNSMITFTEGSFVFVAYDFDKDCVVSEIYKGEVVISSGRYLIQLDREVEVLFNSGRSIDLNDTYSLRTFIR
ncbi:hypothetical protein [Tenacibaculum finnmarkense]|uniref:hypothetical protein n=1 Tax=Tenacibaculum finnmarkense TaxID=2781243 RepID=UPI002079DD95|nr:hypothetical protein [Tenacibaculum finnmarkense]MCM8906794.1 hypothetical protein [Tenacibaculum finnmarkense genomovar finnmarkense]